MSRNRLFAGYLSRVSAARTSSPWLSSFSRSSANRFPAFNQSCPSLSCFFSSTSGTNESEDTGIVDRFYWGMSKDRITPSMADVFRIGYDRAFFALITRMSMYGDMVEWKEGALQAFKQVCARLFQSDGGDLDEIAEALDPKLLAALKASFTTSSSGEKEFKGLSRPFHTYHDDDSSSSSSHPSAVSIDKDVEFNLDFGDAWFKNVELILGASRDKLPQFDEKLGGAFLKHSYMLGGYVTLPRFPEKADRQDLLNTHVFTPVTARLTVMVQAYERGTVSSIKSGKEQAPVQQDSSNNDNENTQEFLHELVFEAKIGSAGVIIPHQDWEWKLVDIDNNLDQNAFLQTPEPAPRVSWFPWLHRVLTTHAQEHSSRLKDQDKK